MRALVSLFERKHILLSATHSPIYLQDFPNTESPDLPYVIDVVRKDFFNEFIRILENDYSLLWDCVYDNIEKLKEIARERAREVQPSRRARAS